ncbi:MAG: asparagine synthase (glutamine-hydrolyzing) [Candidatus Muiribacteriota bacterium]
MCGICGIYNINKKKIDFTVLKEINNTMIHRGPDDEGYYVNNYIGLGHRRLSIIDLKTGHQPVFNEDSSIAVVFNGEIYNFKKIKQILTEKGHIFKTLTDTEVIVHGYEEWGVKCIENFRGMFSFAVWDNNKKQLFIGRDRLGIKPLYYYKDADRIIFSSELKGILQDKTVSKKINYEGMSDFFSYGYVPSPKSIFKNIYKIPPGSTLICDDNKFKIEKYWDLNFEDKYITTEKEYTEKLVDILHESVEMRLISDVPIGAFLSGGVDSSLIVSLMSEIMKEPVITNTIGFDDKNFDESEYAKKTSLFFKTNHNEFFVKPELYKVLDILSWHYDEPFADSSSIPAYYVSKMTRKNVKVALSGDGGDESFGGYRRYYFDVLENYFRKIIPAPIRKEIIGRIASIYPKADRLPQFLRAKTLLTNLSMDSVSGYFNSMSLVLSDQKDKLFSDSVKKELNGYSSVNVFKNHAKNCDSDDFLSVIQYIDFKTYLPDDILVKVDRASMANSLEVRVPILDHKFVEFAASLPSGMKLKGKDSKYILKKASSQKLPEEILNRKKMGFSVPMSLWLKKDLKDLFEKILFSEKEKEIDNFFNQTYIKEKWFNHLKGSEDNSQFLWCLISFYLWADKYL